MRLPCVKRAKALKMPFWYAWPTILDELDQEIAKAQAAGLKVIVDLHEPPLQDVVDKGQFDKAGFSVVRWAPKEDALRWLQESVDLLESLGWSWTYHAFREYNGWSLEHDETYPENSLTAVQSTQQETERAKLIKRAFLKNQPIEK
jgi:aryl-phospho-beta-D-glucosidase BglC (GH1 family)